MRQVFQKPWSYTVMFDELSNTHYLDVLCGGAGMYEVRVKLTSTEVADTSGHWESLDALALKVCRDPDAFADRVTYL